MDRWLDKLEEFLGWLHIPICLHRYVELFEDEGGRGEWCIVCGKEWKRK